MMVQRVVVGNEVFVNCTGDMTIVFSFILFSKHQLNSPFSERLQFFSVHIQRQYRC